METKGSPPPLPAPPPLQRGESVRLPGLVATDIRFTAPLDYFGTPGLPRSLAGSGLTIFAREVVLSHKAPSRASLPAVLYLQGGPGYEGPRPADASGFVKRLAEEFRVILLDQRGTGLSSAVTVESLADISDDPEEQAAYLRCLRADSIIRDAELLRASLLGTTTQWTILGQSFGGFCCLSYLSFFPNSLSAVLITGGLSPAHLPGCSADSVYRRLLPRVIRQMDAYYEAFPADEAVVREVVRHLDSLPERYAPLPSGSHLTVAAFQSAGLSCLGFAGGFARLHYLLERAFEPAKRPAGGGRGGGGGDPNGAADHLPAVRLSSYFLSSIEGLLLPSVNPLYALLHESIYCDGGDEAPAWSAERMRSTMPEFNAAARARAGQRVYLTGEQVYPSSFEDVAGLRAAAGAANALAQWRDWTPLYDLPTLRTNTVPVAAAVYLNDMFVDFELSREVADVVAGVKIWVTSEYAHSGLREHPTRVLDRLFGLLRGKVTLES